MFEFLFIFFVIIPMGMLAWGFVIVMGYLIFFKDGPCSGITKFIATKLKRAKP